MTPEHWETVEFVKTRTGALDWLDDEFSRRFYLEEEGYGIPVPRETYVPKQVLEEAEEERDLAIAHDRQPYPTAEAYEKVCAARTKWQEQAEAAQAEVERLTGEKAHAVVVDFLDSWRYCPVSEAPAASRSCLEDAAKQLLAALAPTEEKP